MVIAAHYVIGGFGQAGPLLAVPVFVARQRMLTEGIDATRAAYDVGYESVSQFSREYSRFFGQPPMRDIKALRDSSLAATTAA